VLDGKEILEGVNSGRTIQSIQKGGNSAESVPKKRKGLENAKRQKGSEGEPVNERGGGSRKEETFIKSGGGTGRSELREVLDQG